MQGDHLALSIVVTRQLDNNNCMILQERIMCDLAVAPCTLALTFLIDLNKRTNHGEGS